MVWVRALFLPTRRFIPLWEHHACLTLFTCVDFFLFFYFITSPWFLCLYGAWEGCVVKSFTYLSVYEYICIPLSDFLSGIIGSVQFNAAAVHLCQKIGTTQATGGDHGRNTTGRGPVYSSRERESSSEAMANASGAVCICCYLAVMYRTGRRVSSDKCSSFWGGKCKRGLSRSQNGNAKPVWCLGTMFKVTMGSVGFNEDFQQYVSGNAVSL